MRRINGAALLTALAVGLFPGAGHALGLGKLQVDSNLGQPLRLQIQLESVTASEAETLDVSLASRSDFARAGIEYPESASLLDFELIADPGGRYRVLISTEDPIQDAYLHFLVSALWSGGKAVREYTALLDPPLYSGNPATGVTLTGQSVADEINAAVSAAEESEAASRSAGGSGAADGSVLVRRGDTLSQIVENIGKPVGVDHFQALEAFYRKNPQAFIENNMNLLRTGVTLQVPSFEEMQNISRRESAASFAAQLEKFNEYRNLVRQKTEQQSTDALNNLIAESTEVQTQVAEPLPPLTPEDLGTAQEAPVEGAPEVADETPAAEDTPTAEADTEEPRLTIGQQVIDSGDVEGLESEQQLETLRSQLAQLDESLLASGVESESVRSNLQQIQDQVDRLSTLIEIEDTNLAQAQNRAADTTQEPDLSDAAAGSAIEDEDTDQSAAATLDDTADLGQDDTGQTLAGGDTTSQDAATQEAVNDILAGSGSAEQALTGADSGVPELAAVDAGQAGSEQIDESSGMDATLDTGVDPEASVEQELSNEAEQIAAAVPTEIQADPAATEADPVESDAVESGEAIATEEPGSEIVEDDEQQAAELVAAQNVSDDGDAAAVDTGDNAASDEPESGVNAAVRKVSDSSIFDSIKGLVAPLAEHGLKIALGLLALIAGLFLWQRRKSQREYDASMLDIETEDVSMNSEASIQRAGEASGIDLASSNDSALELTIGGGMSYLSEEGITGVNEEDNEVIKAGAVDPLAEADVYLAYDRDEQAIQVLKEAFADTPERGELAEKLLEIYHKQDDRRSFDALAGEMQRRVDSTHNFSWEKVAAMGREVSPDNTIYQEGASPKAGAAEPSVLDLDEDLKKKIEESTLAKESSDEEISKIDVDKLNMIEDVSENSAVQGLEVDDLDFDIEEEIAKENKTSEMDAPTLSQIISENVDGRLDDDDEDDDEISLGSDDVKLDLGDDTSPIELVEDKADRSASGDKSETALEDQLDLKLLGDDDDDEEPGIDALSGMSELSEASMNKLEPYHESETALELAKAYLELGEQEIAKGFIEEVLTEGSDKQKTKARKLIKELAS